jgi:transcriptional regulator with XRE-family HTH domain
MPSRVKRSREGTRLRRLRVELRLTQEELARRVGVTTHTIWRLETDPVFNPRLETLRIIVRALGIDIRQFMNFRGNSGQK